MGLLDQSAQAASQPALQRPTPAVAPTPAPDGQAPVTPGLAQAAAAAGAPGPQRQEQGASSPAPGTSAPVGKPASKSKSNRQGAKIADVETEEATPEEQQEYERAMGALASVLYENEKTSNAIVDQVIPEDKIGTTAKVSMLFMQQLDEKIGMDEVVVAQMTQETVTRIMELAEARHGMEYNEQESQAILGATWEGVMAMFGVNEEQHQQLVGSLESDSLAQLKDQYEAALNG